MDLDEMTSTGRLGPSFPLPADGPFTTAQARTAGVSHLQLGRLVTEGLLRRPIKGVLLPTEAGDSLALRVACLKLVAPPDCVVVDRHAGWLLGADMILAPGEHLELRRLSMFRPSGNGRLRNDLARSGERWLRAEDVTEIDGLRVTTALRTAWDLGRVRWPDEAITGLDAMMRLGAFGREELLAGVEQFKGQRWIRTLRAVAPLADGRSESPGESVLRLRCHEVGLAVQPQVEVRRGSTVIARLDLGNEDLLAAIEYDGLEWHSSPDQLLHDRRRRDEVRVEGWLVEAVTKQHVFGRARECEAIIRDLRRRALARRGRRTAG